MAEPRFADDDDLPRTLRRERDAREREMREREKAAAAAAEESFGAAGAHPFPSQSYRYDYAPTGDGGVAVTRLRIPFLHLMFFFMKAVVAAIPALILLTVILWGMGQGLKAFLPGLRHFEIIVKST
jgi:hypothetical protein